MGEKQNQPFQLSLNASVKVDFQGSRVTSDGGLILVRELDERLRLQDLIAQHLIDSRRRKNTQLPLADLLRQSVYSRIAGYEDVKDAEGLSQDPTFRLIGSEKIWERGAALTSRLQSFETEVLTQDEIGRDQSGADRQSGNHRLSKARGAGQGLDRDSGLWPAGEERVQRSFRIHLLPPTAAVQSRGRLSGGKLRPGNVHGAEDWKEMLLPEIERQQRLGKEVVFRADAAFAKPEIYEVLEERGVKYAIRIPSNENLERDIAELLTRPVGRPSDKPVVWYKSFLYQAASWKTARRVVAKSRISLRGVVSPRGVHRDQPGDR
jgi:hypothetical protein